MLVVAVALIIVVVMLFDLKYAHGESNIGSLKRTFSCLHHHQLHGSPTIVSSVFPREFSCLLVRKGPKLVAKNDLHPVLLIQPMENATFHDDAALGEDAALSSNGPSSKHNVKHNRQRETYAV